MNEIVKSVSIENLVNQRAAVATLLEQGLNTLSEAYTLSCMAHLGFAEIQMVVNGQRSHSHRICGYSSEPLATLLAVSLKSVDAGAWSYLMHESGLRTFMDATARKEWDEKIYAQDVPPLTVENIEATFSTLHGARGDMFERGVLAVFRSLSWNYKTNEPFKFGKRIIVDGLFYSYGSGTNRWLSTNRRQTNALDDLTRVFHILDGKPEPDHRNGWDNRISQAERGRAQSCQGDYFDMKWFKKGTGHILFTRPDLVEKMNLILAKHHPDALACDVR